MLTPLFRLCSLVVLLSVAAIAQQSTTLGQETSNNTSACSGNGTPSYCSGGFTGMSDSASGVFNAAPGNVSTEDIHQLFYSGNNTRVFAHYQPWFCMGSSSSTGTGSSCGSHLQVGYNSADSSTVHGQINDMIQRGFDGIVVDFYGTAGSSSELTTTDMVNNDVANRCSGSQNCPAYFAVNYDQGAFMYKCPQNGGGTDQTQCIINHMETDFDYMNSHYFGALGYLRVDTSSMQISASGNPVVYFFICETCFTNPSPNWTNIWSALRQYTSNYGNNAPNLFLFRNSGAFTHAQTDGGFAWVNHYNGSDTYGYVYLQNFYDQAKSSTQSNPALLTTGAAWKGFDNTDAPWAPAPSVTSQQCGQTWLHTFQQATHNSDFGSSNQLPFSEVATWNDYEEGTEIETGIDNCLSLTAAMANDGTTLNWTLNFSSASGSENTVHHYLVFDSTDGSTLTQIAKVASGTHSLDLTQFSLSTGSHTLYVKAVGQPSILNQMSNAVAFSPGASTTVQSVSLNPTSTAGGNNSTGTVTLSQPAGSSGVVVTLASDNAAASVPAQVTVSSGNGSANFTVATQSVSTNTTANISASIGSGSSTSAALTITAAPPVTVSQVGLNPSTVTGGAGSTGTVTLSQAAGSGGTVVTLSSNNAAASVGSQVTVPAGSTSTTFPVSTTSVSSTTSASISASIGSSSASASLTIQPPAAPTVSNVALNPTSLTGGSASSGIVTLSQAAGSGGVVVTLSSNSSAATVPSQVTVSAGSTSAGFSVSTTNVSSTTTATISAKLGSSSASANLTITPTPSATLSQVSFSSSSIGGSNQVTLTVSLSAAAPSGGVSVKLSSNSSAVPVPSSLTVRKGASSASTTITTHTVTSTTTATVIGTYSGASQSASITVNVTPASLSLSSSSIVGGNSVTGTITLTGAAPGGGEVVQLTDNSSYVSVPSSVTVAAGSKSAQFKITTTKTSSTKSATITATALGVSKTASLTVKH